MAELATDLYRPDLVDDNGQSSALVKSLSPTVEVVNGHTTEMRFLGKKLKKKKKKSGKEEKLLSEPQPIQFPSVNGQETISGEESLAVEPVTTAEDQEPLFAVPENILEAALPEEDPVPEAESAHELLTETPLPGHINGGKLAFSVPGMTLTPYSHGD